MLLSALKPISGRSAGTTKIGGSQPMKIERLYAVTVYLLNHGRTSARELAKRFEVSVRTIQRDIDSLCLAGIPIISVAGAAGGYEISAQFRLDNHLATSGDYSYILTALKGLVSATNDINAKHTLEKISHIHKHNGTNIILDFSVLREGDQTVLQALQTAIAKKCMVDFIYTNNDNKTHAHCVEPIAVLYRWYSWYLLAYSKAKGDYCTYKLVRMRDLRTTNAPFTKVHDAPEIILKKSDKTDSRQYTDVLVKCKERARSRVQEYLKGTAIEKLPDGDTLMKLIIVENEQLWIGTLLSLGDDVEVMEPKEIRQRLVAAAHKIISLYK